MNNRRRKHRGNRPGNFSQEIKDRARQRAGFCCEKCQKDFSSPNCKEKLTVHHRLPIAVALSHYPEISASTLSSLMNAQALCQDCHDIEDQLALQNHPQIAEELKKSYR